MQQLNDTGRQLLVASVGAPDAAARAWAEWRQTHTVDAAGWGHARMFPMIAHQLALAGVDDPDLARLRGIQRHSWAKNMALAADAVRCTKLLGALGAPAMVLKGVGLQHAYPKPGLRSMGDADLLVRPEHARLAMVALYHDGWEYHLPVGPQQAAAVVRATTAITIRRSQRNIDLHWHPLHTIPRGLETDLWARAREQQVPGGTVLAPDPSHQLLIVLAHGLRRFSGSEVQGLGDAAMLLRTGTCTAEVAADLAAQWSRVSVLREGIDLLRRHVGGEEVERFADGLRRTPRARWRDRVEHAAAQRPYDDRRRRMERLVRIGRPAPPIEHPSPALRVGRRMSFSNAAECLDLQRAGWSMVEPWGTWTDGPVARLGFSVDDPSRATSFVLTAHAVQQPDPQRVRVHVNGRRAAVWHWPADNATTAQRVPLPLGVRDIEIELRIRRRVIVSGSDPRLLGLAVIRVSLEHDTAGTPVTPG